MNEYPRTVLELRDQFRDELTCQAYLAKRHWPDGFVCPRCQGRDAWVTARSLCHYRRCQHQTSVTAGTLFADTNLPLRLWFEAMWQVTNQKYGASALGLQRLLGLGSYHTAWNWLHKLRRAMVRPGWDRLQGLVDLLSALATLATAESRFNRWTSRSRGLLLYRLVEQAVALEPVLTRSLVGGRGSEHNK